MSVVEDIPPRVKYYLLDWKDKNRKEYAKWYGNKSLRELSRHELVEMFVYAFNQDVFYINDL